MLLTKTPFGESAKRIGDDKWSFDAFDLNVDISSATGAFSRNEQTTGQFLHFWPSVAGAFQPASSPTGAAQGMPWELHGVRVGYSTPSAVRAYKERADHSQTLTANETRFALHSDVIVVPIQVVVVRPNYDAPAIDSIMDLFRREVQDVIWDDRWKAQRQVVNHPGGLLAQVQGKWLLGTRAVRIDEQYDKVISFSAERTTSIVLPDGVYDQCQIQFRLVRYQELELRKELVEFVYSNPDGSTELVCNENARRFRYKEILGEALAANPRLDPALPIVVFNYAIQAPYGCSTPVADSSCPPGVCLTGGSVFYGYLNVQKESNRDLILAHELGHVLDLDDETCSSRTGKELMCGATPLLTAEIPLHHCPTARAQARKYLDHYVGGRVP
jgi:hypothetical protein